LEATSTLGEKDITISGRGDSVTFGDALRSTRSENDKKWPVR